MTVQTEFSQAPHTPEAKLCVFEYLYRDASNYKAWGEILLSGGPTDGGTEELRNGLESGKYFVAENVGVPAVYEQLWKLSGGPTEDDHALHEFAGVRAATEEEIESMPLFGSWSDLLLNFKSVTAWDYSLSPNCAIAS